MRPLLTQLNLNKVLSIYQIVGGLIGIALTSAKVLKIFSTNVITNLPVILIFWIVCICFFSFSIICGALLLKKPSLGLKLSRINQLLQLISFYLLGYSFRYVAGILLGLRLDWTNTLEAHFDIYFSNWKLLIDYGVPYGSISINIVAAILISLINYKLSKLKRQDLLQNFVDGASK